MAVGSRVRAYRERAGASQEDMAQQLGVSRTYISQIENDRILPMPLMLAKIANALRTSMLSLLPTEATSANHASHREDPSSRELLESFEQLQPHQKAMVLSAARRMITHSLIPLNE